jgi:hypothetical protein
MVFALYLVQGLPIWKIEPTIRGKNAPLGTLRELFEVIPSQAHEARLAHPDYFLSLCKIHHRNTIVLLALLAVGAGVGRWACWWFLEGGWER